MKQITEDYVSFETAQLLKEKGFGEYTLGFYKDNKKKLDFDRFADDWNTKHVGYIAAPSQSLALKWLREVHKWSIQVFPVFDNLKWCYDIYELKIQKYHSRPELLSNVDYDTYEQAVDAALLCVLKNLI